MNPVFLLRLALDFTAASLLLAGLAYYWLDNVAHELIGTAMFLLVLVHNVFNRRWYGRLSKTPREALGLSNTVTILSLAAVMLVLLATSLMISKSVFSFLPLSGGYTVRQIHTLAAYWALVIVSIHLGMRWSMIMSTFRSLCGITGTSTVRVALLRVTALAIAVYGIHSAIVMGIGSKLTAEVSMDFWDFEASTFRFFAHTASILALGVFLGHYTAQWLRNWKKRRRAATSV